VSDAETGNCPATGTAPETLPRENRYRSLTGTKPAGKSGRLRNAICLASRHGRGNAAGAKHHADRTVTVLPTELDARIGRFVQQ
jgi:hypothetical protein